VGARNGDILPPGSERGGAGTRSEFRDVGNIDGGCPIRRQPGQLDGEDASPAGDVARIDLAAVRADALTGDCEPEAQAASVLASLLEEGKQVFGSSGKATAFVLDRDENPIGVCVRPHQDMTPGARVLARVLQQVRDRRREDLSVYLDPDSLRDGRDRELQAPSLRFDLAATSTSSMNSASGTRSASDSCLDAHLRDGR
jgi:hypothetical protein